MKIPEPWHCRGRIFPSAFLQDPGESELKYQELPAYKQQVDLSAPFHPTTHRLHSSSFWGSYLESYKVRDPKKTTMPMGRTLQP